MNTNKAFADPSIHSAPSIRPDSWEAVIILLLVTSLFLAGCGGGNQAQKEAAGAAPPPVPVVVATVVQKTVPIITEFTAKTDAKDTVELRARVEAFLEGIHFEEGKPVTKGQVLFTLDKRKYEADLQNSRAQLAKAKADLEFAKDKTTVDNARARVDQSKAQLEKADLDVNRLTPLAKENAVPQQDLDNALVAQKVAQSNLTASQATLETTILNQKVSIDQATAAVSAGEAAVKNAELNVSYCAITAPIDGLIGQRLVSVGNLVGRGEPTLLATLSALDPLRVSFALSETEYLTLAKRMGESTRKPLPLDLILADGTVFPHKGRVTIASRAVDERTGTLTLIAEFPNPSGLIRPGQFGRVRGIIDVVENATLVPQVAVMETQSAKTAYVVGNDGKVAVRTLVLGERVESQFVVKDGIKPGERVIVEGMQKVRPGMTVAATEQTPPAGK